jgi:hypothetical protein
VNGLQVKPMIVEALYTCHTETLVIVEVALP